MQKWFSKNPYTVVAVVFLAILLAGRHLWGWGALAFAYFLLLYCIVAVAIKLDEIAAGLNTVAGLLRKIVVSAAESNPVMGHRHDNTPTFVPHEHRSLNESSDNPDPLPNPPDRIDNDDPPAE